MKALIFVLSIAGLVFCWTGCIEPDRDGPPDFGDDDDDNNDNDNDNDDDNNDDDTDTNTNTDTETETETSTETETETSTGTETETSTGTETDTSTWTDTSTGTDTDTGTDIDAGLLSDAGPDACVTDIAKIENHPYDFEGPSDDGWLLTTSPDWEAGSPYAVLPYEGKCVLATNLEGSYPYYAYGDASSPSIDLSHCGSSDKITLKFAMAYQIEYTYGCYNDYGYLQVYNGSYWTVVTPTPGYDYGVYWCGPLYGALVWREYSVDVSSYARGNDDFRISFFFNSNGTVEYSGMYIDMVRLEHSY